jgi:hypothetical protein
VKCGRASSLLHWDHHRQTIRHAEHSTSEMQSPGSSLNPANQT